jgi:hypothetical protein
LKPLSKGIIVGIITVVVYLGVVIITTPALAPFDAVSAAFQINSFIILGMGIGIGLQTYLSSYSKKLGCRLSIKKKAFGGNTGGTALTSFLSFFSLVPLGCCGWWLYALSLLPSIFGTGISAILIEYNQPLSYLGLVIIFGFSGLTAYKLRQERKISI